MADDIDQAQQNDEFFRQQAIQAHFSGLSRTETQTFTSECVECGEPIEPARLTAMPKAIRCLDCQARHERLYGRTT
jgi:phage/conjugal plasmid C-4 type zinc finger TraR family protein